ncbi:WXG100 family type VII secretion target [Nocardia sp. NPDC058666]|uniref:WXG100 family type VII secretion target n=1 Tax=Nocardia sp. NPDC058666 TaxID=3346587 RepID=UPI00365A85EE
MSTLGGDGQSLTVVPEKVRDVGTFVYGLADTLRQALDIASREVDACAGGSWTGDYAESFATAWSETRSGGVAVISALTEMAEKLGVSADTYSQADQSFSADLGAFSLDLPGL